ncbi:MAG TPA: hypothetical protein PKD90_08635 [Phnomibacter sp.]|nr:hypothetical protein [Phnomibacter sp.]
MKKMMTMLAGLLLVACLSANAQRPNMTVAERVSRTIERIKPELNLTDKQVKEVEPVYTDFYNKLDAARGDGPPSPEARQKLTEERNEKLKKILDEAQMKKLAELDAQMRQRGPRN